MSPDRHSRYSAVFRNVRSNNVLSVSVVSVSVGTSHVGEGEESMSAVITFVETK